MNKVALVTGANQGIGFATVRLLLEQDIIVILTARDEKKALVAKQTINHKIIYFLYRISFDYHK